MRRKFIFLLAPLAALMLTACGTHLKVANVDPSTGLLKSEMGPISQATVVTAKSVPLSKFNGLVLVTDAGAWGRDQMKATNLFQEVLSIEDLEKLVVAKNLQAQIPSITPITLTTLAKAYKPFLWVQFKRVSKDNSPYLQMIATDPETLNNIFVSEVYLDYIWVGVSDQNARYPLFNEFITWAKKNQ